MQLAARISADNQYAGVARMARFQVRCKSERGAIWSDTKASPTRGMRLGPNARCLPERPLLGSAVVVLSKLAAEMRSGAFIYHRVAVGEGELRLPLGSKCWVHYGSNWKGKIGLRNALKSNDCNT